MHELNSCLLRWLPFCILLEVTAKIYRTINLTEEIQLRLTAGISVSCQPVLAFDIAGISHIVMFICKTPTWLSKPVGGSSHIFCEGMAAYGALITLTNLIKPIRHYQEHRYPIFADHQLMQLESLEQKVLFLQKFLETYSSGRRSDDCEALEGQIEDVLYFAQDFIESRIADVIRAHFRGVADADSDVRVESDMEGYGAEDYIIKAHITDEICDLCVTTWKTDSDDLFSQGLHNVMQVLELIQYNASKIAENAESLKKDKQPGDSTSVGLDKPPTTDLFKDTSVTFGDTLDKMMDKLLNRKKVELHTIPVTGMGGIGKTTLAQTVYHNPRIVQHFDVRGWIAISQEFSPEGILFGLLSDMKVTSESDSKDDYHELGDKLYKHLYGRRYLIILDDVWSVEAWDKIKRFLPDNKQRSRIILTTRLSALANSVSSSNEFKMSLLNENESWSLLRRKVFSTESSCTPELEEIGKKIAKCCKGLPLSISVVGGLLGKSMDREYWRSIEKDVTGSVNSKVSDHCLRILGTSYHHLPIHLKPCFLYFGVYPEDHEIKVTDLINLWVAEGFLEPKGGKSLEEVAYEYLQELANRNLIIVSKWKLICRKIKVCKIHDLLRDLCLKEDEKKRFRSQSYCSQNKIYIHSSTGEHQNYPTEYNFAFPLSSLVRSLEFDDDYSSSNLKLLRIWKLRYQTFSHCIFDTVNVRYLNVWDTHLSLFSMNYLLWNLHSLLLGCSVDLPYEIWEMPQLRHLESVGGFTIRDPCGANGVGEHNIVLENLHTIGWVKNFRCSEEIVGKILNLKKLKIDYDEVGKMSSGHLKNLGRLTKLESLSYRCLFPDYCLAFESKMELSVSITKLVFTVGYFKWEDMGKHIGSLPHLQKLHLFYENGGEEWNLSEGEFPSLRYLCFFSSNLVRWTTNGGSVLPCLEHLVLLGMRRMEGIPLEIGDIPTLQSIQLYGNWFGVYCSESVIDSAREILEDQRQLGNEDLHLHISSNYDGHRYEINETFIDTWYDQPSGGEEEED